MFIALTIFDTGELVLVNTDRICMIYPGGDGNTHIRMSDGRGIAVREPMKRVLELVGGGVGD